MHRWLSLLSAVVVAVLLAGQGLPARQQPAYRLITLASLGGAEAYAKDVNARGWVAGDSLTASGALHGFLWRSGIGYVDLGTLGGTLTVVNDMNDAGTVVGRSMIANDHNQHAYRYDITTGILTDLHAQVSAGGPDSSALGINAGGDIVGWSTNTDGAKVPFFLPAQGTVIRLAGIGGLNAAAYDVTDDRRIVGAGEEANWQERSVLWACSAPSCGPVTLAGRASSAYKISDSGFLVGNQYDAAGFSRAYRGTSSGGVLTSEDLGTLHSGEESMALGVNSAGHVVGQSHTSFLENPVAFLRAGGGMVDLNTFVDSSLGLLLVEATDVNDNGLIAGSARNGTTVRPFVLVPADSALCTFSVSSTAANVGGAAATVSVEVTASASNCEWTLTSPAPWLTPTGAATRTGSGVVQFTVAANATGSTRTAAATVAGHAFTVTQTSATTVVLRSSETLTASYQPTQLEIRWGASGGDLLSTITSNVSWITVNCSLQDMDTTVPNGCSTTRAELTRVINVASLAAAAPRTGQVTISGGNGGNSVVITVTQTAAPLTFSVAPQTWNAPGGGGVQRIAVGVNSSDAAWSALASVPWLTAQYAGGTGSVALIAGENQQTLNLAGLAVDRQGIIFGTDTSGHRIWRVTPAGEATIIAGGTEGTADGTGTAAQFKSPAGIAIDSAGNLLVADAGNHRIRRITPAGIVTTLAGSAQGDNDGTIATARFDGPTEIAVDPAGTIYVTCGNTRVRQITAAGTVTTIVQNTVRVLPCPQGVTCTSSITGLATDRGGSLYMLWRHNWGSSLLSSAGPGTIEKRSPSGRVETMLTAANAEPAILEPLALVVGADGTMFVATGSYTVKFVNVGGGLQAISQTGVSTSLPGGALPADGVNASFTAPAAIALDPAGGLVMARFGSVRRITASGPGTMTLVADPNPGAARMGEATVAGRTVTVWQAANTNAVTLGPATLQFQGVNNAGMLNPITSPQPLTVTLSGSGIVPWTLSADQPWVHLSQSSGFGSGTVMVSVVNPGNVLGASTTVSATLTLTASNVTHDPGTATVKLSLTPASTLTAPFGQVDTPAQAATGLVGAIAVTGWALDDVGIAGVKIYRNCLPFDDPASCQIIDGASVVFIGDAAFVSGARTDVESAYSSFPNARRAGWGYLLLTSMLPHVTGQQAYGGQGPLTLYVFATDVEGRRRLLGRSSDPASPHYAAPTTITMANDSIGKPFGAIDTPGQGETVTGLMNNFGWALTPDSDTVAGNTDTLIPTDGSTMFVFIDGAPVSTVTYNQCRGSVGNPVPSGNFCNDDVSNIFGNPAPQPVFTARTANPTRHRNLDAGRAPIGSFQIDTRTLSIGIHSIAWSVTDSAGRTEGIGSRQFNVLNGGSRPAAARADAHSLPVELVPGRVDGRAGFDLAAPWQEIAADANGDRAVRINELGRLELRLPTEISSGYLRVGDELRGLPAGSRRAHGSFTWAPPAGYLGRYDLVFAGASGQLPVAVTVAQGTGASEGTLAAAIDLPSSSVSGPFTIAGWALDRLALSKAGIGAVHVWAFRKGADPMFLGAAAVGGERPDVAAEYGAQFAPSGWSLSAPALADGEYQLVAYFWSARTGRFEDARSVGMTVR